MVFVVNVARILLVFVEEEVVVAALAMEPQVYIQRDNKVLEVLYMREDVVFEQILGAVHHIGNVCHIYDKIILAEQCRNKSLERARRPDYDHVRHVPVCPEEFQFVAHHVRRLTRAERAVHPRTIEVQVCLERAARLLCPEGRVPDFFALDERQHARIRDIHQQDPAMLAFYTRLASILTGIPNVALSNESSANESTVLGTSVNHQYSKSLEFEDDFRAYCPGFNYFSFLRPLSELQIAMLFSQFVDYHDVFRSCNVGSKQDIWCGHCAKCLFAYIILSPFIAPARLNRIFGKSMLDDLSLQHEFDQLTGQAETKPFECVGTVNEVLAALSMAKRRWYKEGCPALLKKHDADSSPVKLNALLPIGNLTEEERNIIKQCIEKFS